MGLIKFKFSLSNVQVEDKGFNTLDVIILTQHSNASIICMLHIA